MGRKHQCVCALCGTVAEVTREHFVPQCLWSGPLPQFVETVPACDDCNGRRNHDDAYFRDTLVMMFEQDHPDKKALFESKVRRSLERRPRNVRLMLDGVIVQPMFTPSGIWLGNFPVLPLNWERFERSLLKVVKGLFYIVREQPFPAHGRIQIFGQVNEYTRTIDKHLFPDTFNFGDSVFEWRFAQTRDGLSMWQLAFYQSVVFYALGWE